MSRCFPFPPPGYGARGDALIESIKLREEMVKAEKDRKEKKKEKKEKKREKKEKKEKRKEEKDRKLKQGTATPQCTDDGKKFKLINELKETKSDGKLLKGEDCENEQLERSGITEELDQPVTSVEPCCLSDSTQSSKRKRSSPQSTHDHGSAIKIRLPLRKHREPEELISKSKFQVGSSSGSVGTIADFFTKSITLGSDSQSQCQGVTEPKRVLGNSDSRHGKVNLVRGDAVVTKNAVGSDCQTQCLRIPEPKRVPGNFDARHGKALQNLVHGDAVVTKNAVGSDRQSQCLRIPEPKRVPGNSDSRHGKALQNLVHGDAVVTNNTLGSDRQSQCLRIPEPKRVIGNSDSRNGKAKQNSVNGDGVVTKNTLRSDPQLKSLPITESKRVVGKSDSKHSKALQKLDHGDAMDIDTAVDVGIQKVASLYTSLLQVSPITQDGMDPVDEDWLFSSERAETKPVSKKQKCDSDDIFQLSSSMWPRAQYLPAVEIYALPYAVPF